MATITFASKVVWAACILLKILLFAILRKNQIHRRLPLFSIYLLTTLAHDAFMLVCFSLVGYLSAKLYTFAWIAISFVILARALAIAELCGVILGGYRGVWGLAKRLMLVTAGVVSGYALLASNHQWKFAILAANRALELSMAATVVVLFLFLKYYQVEVHSAFRTLAAGFCLYSCLVVVNTTVLEKLLFSYSLLWTLLEMVTFLATLLLWSTAVWKPLPVEVPRTDLVAPGLYAEIIPEVNARLRRLNERLSDFWKAEVHRSL